MKPCYSPSSSVSTLEAEFSLGLKYAMSGAKYCTFFIRVVSWISMYRKPENQTPQQSVFTWHHSGHIGVLRQRNGGHVGVPN